VIVLEHNITTNASWSFLSFCQLSEYASVWKYIDFRKNTWGLEKLPRLFPPFFIEPFKK
jgi:hypothetical protein